ncbi:hypothetical protein [Catellatospora vulcania]|uniref:hypothetical protein n=1 Tax=Catellatospora vulcania TaxID=1460450 RepID=UPI0012D377D1|nr:hypothetical protein [Catellatospora vulcania]
MKRFYRHLCGAAAILAVVAVATTLTLRAGVAHASAAETAPCAAAGVTRTDEALARSLNAQLATGMPGRISGYQASCARAIVQEVQARGLDRRAAVITVAAALVEGGLNNYTRIVDDGGAGLFHQGIGPRPNDAAKLLDARRATDEFLDRMQRLYPHGSWHQPTIDQVSRRVQGSADIREHVVQDVQAQRIVDAIWSTTDPA